MRVFQLVPSAQLCLLLKVGKNVGYGSSQVKSNNTNKINIKKGSSLLYMKKGKESGTRGSTLQSLCCLYFDSFEANYCFDCPRRSSLDVAVERAPYL